MVHGAALLQTHDGNDRLVLDHGAPGAPVFDCGGPVVAVVTTAIAQAITYLSSAVHTSTAWQTPNVVSVPIQALAELPRSHAQLCRHLRCSPLRVCHHLSGLDLIALAQDVA